VLLTGDASPDCLNELHIRVKQAFSQDALAYHASCSKDEDVHA
jgi:hypothetical protein